MRQTSGKVAVSWSDCRADTTYNRKTLEVDFFEAFDGELVVREKEGLHM